MSEVWERAQRERIRVAASDIIDRCISACKARLSAQTQVDDVDGMGQDLTLWMRCGCAPHDTGMPCAGVYVDLSGYDGATGGPIVATERTVDALMVAAAAALDDYAKRLRSDADHIESFARAVRGEPRPETPEEGA